MTQVSESSKTRVTITLPTALVRELDEKLATGETGRAATIRRLIEDALRARELRERRQLQEQADEEQYIRAWREQPDTVEEFGWMTTPQAMEHLAEIPWGSDEAPSGGRTCQSRGDDGPSS